MVLRVAGNDLEVRRCDSSVAVEVTPIAQRCCLTQRALGREHTEVRACDSFTLVQARSKSRRQIDVLDAQDVGAVGCGGGNSPWDLEAENEYRQFTIVVSPLPHWIPYSDSWSA